MDNNNLSTSELLSSRRDRTVVDEFLHSAAYAGLQAPIQGATQIAEQVTGKTLVPSVTFMDGPEHAQFGSSRWHAQQLGSMVGMAAPFLLMHKGVGKLGNMAFGKIEANAANQALLARRVIGETAVTGALFEGALRPTTAQEGDFLTARTRNALVGGATFATLASASIGIRSMARAENGIMGAVARNEVAATALAGLPAGFVNAELTSLGNGKGLATGQQLYESMYTFSVLGGTMAAGKLAIGRTHSEQGLNRELRADSEQARANGEPTLAQRTDAALNRLADGAVNLADRIGGPRPQFAMAGIGAPVRFTEAAPVGPTVLEMRATNGGGGRPLRGGIGDNVVSYEPAPSNQPRRGGAGGGNDASRVSDNRAQAPKPEAPKVEAPVKTPAQVALEKANKSFAEAQDALHDHLHRRRLQRDLEDANHQQGPNAATEVTRARQALEREMSSRYLHPDRALMKIAEAVQDAQAAVNAEPNAAAKARLAKDAGVQLEAMMGRVGGSYRGANGGADLPRFSSLEPNNPSRHNPVSRLNDLNNHLQGRLAEIRAGGPQPNGPVMEAPAAKPANAPILTLADFNTTNLGSSAAVKLNPTAPLDVLKLSAITEKASLPTGTLALDGFIVSDPAGPYRIPPIQGVRLEPGRGLSDHSPLQVQLSSLQAKPTVVGDARGGVQTSVGGEPVPADGSGPYRIPPIGQVVEPPARPVTETVQRPVEKPTGTPPEQPAMREVPGDGRAKLISFEKESGAGKHTYWIPNRKNPRMESGLDRKVVYGEDGRIVAEVKFDRSRTAADVDAELSRMMRQPTERTQGTGDRSSQPGERSGTQSGTSTPESRAEGASSSSNVLVPPEQLVGFFTDGQTRPLRVLAPDSIMGILAGEPYPDLGRFAVELYKEAGRTVEQNGSLRAAKTEAQLQQLFAETIRDILPEFRANWPTPVEPTSVATLFGTTAIAQANLARPARPRTSTDTTPSPEATPPAGGGTTRPPRPTDAVQASVSPFTVRAVLQLAANDMSNPRGRVAPGQLEFNSLADVASLSRNLHGRGGLPINGATAQAVINRAIAEGLLTPTDTVSSLQTRIDGLPNWQQTLRFTNLRR